MKRDRGAGAARPNDVPPAQTLLFENDRTRVWEMQVEAGAEYPLHPHRLPYLSIVLEPASLVLVDERGVEEGVEAVPGAVFWREPPEMHAVRNVGRTRFRNRLVEFLSPT